MINTISGLAFVTLLAIGAVLALPLTLASPGAALLLAAIWLSGSVFAAMSIKWTAAWERALVFRRGRYLGMRGPGALLVIPFVDQLRIVDIRIRVTREVR